MSIVTRFAPSPTGYIHIGNARTAIANWLFAKGNGGRFILRLDDTDVERSKLEYANAIERDLKWFGIIPDEFHRQSERFSIYMRAAEKLKSAGLLYPSLRDCRRARPAPQTAPRAKTAAGLRPRGFEVDTSGPRQTRKRGQTSALAFPPAQFFRRSIQAGPHGSSLGRFGPRPPDR